MELSTAEMDALRTRIEGQRDQLRSIVDAIGDALGIFGSIVQHDTDANADVTAGLVTAKHAFSARLASIFGDDGASESSQFSGVHSNLVNLADQLIRLLSATAEQASMKKELEVARVVQALLVPPEDRIDCGFVQVAGWFQPASECGGDWWSLYRLPGGRVLTLVGDVTGHGISSAIITGAAKAACDLACQVTEGRLTPGDLLRMMNAAIHETARRQIMMTCTASMFDPATKTLSIANAGHHFPYQVRGNALRPLVAHG
jgi:hypothetical protein